MLLPSSLILGAALIISVTSSSAIRRIDTILGDNVTLECDLDAGRKDGVEWEQMPISHGAGPPPPLPSTRQVEGSNGSLLIQSVSLEDHGLYRCCRRGACGTLSHLHVQVGAVLTDSSPESNPILVGKEGEIRLKCSAVGIPTPKIHWHAHPQDPSSTSSSSQPEFELEEESKDRDIIHPAGYVRSVALLRILKGGHGSWGLNVTCNASNRLGSSEGSSSRMFEILRTILPDEEERGGSSSKVQEEEEEEEPSGYCARYSGTVCQGQLSDPSSVWFNISSSDASGGWLNEQLVLGVWEEVLRTLKEPCQSAAKRLLCLHAFPECHLDEDGYPRRLPLCYEDCVATRQLFCAEEWARLESNSSRGFFIGSRGHFRLPVCEQLPRAAGSGGYFRGTYGSSRTPYGGQEERASCSRGHLTQLVPAQVTTSCVKGRGRFYQGNVSHTKDGIPCQRWDAQEPHSHNRPPLNIFPEMQGAENFCRNAGGQEQGPWCYTRDPLVRWQHCDIPPCSSSSSSGSHQDHVEVALLPMESTFTPGFVLLLSGLGFLSLLIIFLFLLICRRAFKPKSRRGYRLPSLQKQSMDIDLQKLRDNSTYQCVNAASQIHPILERLEYPRNDIIYVKDLGHGAFGRVFQARAPNLVKGEPCTVVAVKTLREEADEEMRANFEKEACLLAELDHPNIIALLGVCATEKPFCLLLEFMALGDLRQYLRSCAPPAASSADSSPSSTAVELKLYASDLTSMGRQIAAGMVYLSQRGFVHRDLATRNCLVGPDGSVKIADFGLSQRVLHWQQFYCGTDNDAIPIRWMPLESIVFNRYTAASDVWAFGVCLWEIFSYGAQPYGGMSHEEVVRFLQSGGLLPAPSSASCALYALMRSCWASSPADRPDFLRIHEELVQIQEALLDQDRREGNEA